LILSLLKRTITTSETPPAQEMLKQRILDGLGLGQRDDLAGADVAAFGRLQRDYQDGSCWILGSYASILPEALSSFLRILEKLRASRKRE
jgi:hypothetical protein